MLLVVLLCLLTGASACSITVGCTKYSLFEPDIAAGYQVDSSACSTEPPASIPEAPLAIALPGAAVLAGGVVLMARRRRIRRAAYL